MVSPSTIAYEDYKINLAAIVTDGGSILNLLVLSLVFPSVCFDKESYFYILQAQHPFCDELNTKKLQKLTEYTSVNTEKTQNNNEQTIPIIYVKAYPYNGNG